MDEISGSVRRRGLISAQIEADKALCGPHRGNQRADAEDVHDALEIVGEHVQRHFGADPLEAAHLEVGRPHPRKTTGDLGSSTKGRRHRGEMRVGAETVVEIERMARRRVNCSFLSKQLRPA